MRKKIIFENGNREIQIKHDADFKKLNLISAIINKADNFKIAPSVELILSNDKTMFTSYSNLIPGTTNFNCFDLLLIATNNPALLNEKYHTLKCIVSDNIYDSDVVINMEFEIE